MGAVRLRISQITVLRLVAKNDNLGNPRAVYVLVHPLFGVLSAVDIGYASTNALNELGLRPNLTAQLKLQIIGPIHVAPSEYRQ